MKCEYCYTEVPEGCVFCISCGTRLPAAKPSREHVSMPEMIPERISEASEKVIPAEKPVALPAGIPAISFFWEPDEDDFPVIHMQQTVRQEETPAATQVQEELPAEAAPGVPNLWLPTGRSWVKMMLLGIVTLGIYPVVIWSRMATELNIAASRYDGKRTMPWFAMVLLSVVTLSVFGFVWHHRFCRRIGTELKRRRINFQLSPRDFWLWNVLGSLILAGPVVYVHRVTKAMNLINEDYNSCG